MGSALRGALAAKSGGGVPEGERHKADGAGKVGTSFRQLNNCQKSKGNEALFFPQSQHGEGGKNHVAQGGGGDSRTGCYCSVRQTLLSLVESGENKKLWFINHRYCRFE